MLVRTGFNFLLRNFEKFIPVSVDNAQIRPFCLTFNVETRPNASPGLWLMYLLPLAILASLLKHNVEASRAYNGAGFMCLGFILTALIIAQQCKQERMQRIQLFILIILSSICLASWRYILGLQYHHFDGLDFLVCLAYSGSSTILNFACYILILKLFPKSFTLGEGAIIAQSIILWSVDTIYTYISYTRSSPISPSNKLQGATAIIELGLLGIAVVATIICIPVFKRTKGAFYLVAYFVLLLFSFRPLCVILDMDPVTWILLFMSKDSQLLNLFFFWIVCVCIAIIAIMRQIHGAQRASTITRKIFHILMVAVYVPGLYYNCTFLYLSSGLMLGVLVFLEILRIGEIPPLSKHLESALILYKDAKDAGILAMTPIYLLAGCSLPLWIHPAPCDLTNSAGYYILPLLSGLLTIGIGDTCASFFGSKFGKYHWKDSAKTIEGSIACFMGQLVFIIVFNNFYPFHFLENLEDFIRLLAGIFITTLVEAKTDQIDNIVLPLIMYIILMSN